MFNETVIALVVTYNPRLEHLHELLEVVSPQVTSVVVVDNGSIAMQKFVNPPGNDRIHMIANRENIGVAAAQNAGIKWAQKQGADYVLLLDQDSIPAPDMVSRLLDAVKGLRSTGQAVASVGPRFLDERLPKRIPFFRQKGLRIERCACNYPDAVIPVDYVISSGCLIPASVIEVVGSMQDDLFIDYIDIEWGMRAKYKGFQSFGVCSAHMRHSLGEPPVKILGHNFLMYNPMRYYYRFRNALWMYRQPWLPLGWKIANAWRMLFVYCFYPVFIPPRLKIWRMMNLGLWHGLAGRYGRCDRVHNS